MNMIVSKPMNAIDKDNNPLASLVNFERTVVKVDVEKPIKAHFLNDDKMIQFDYKGERIFGKLDRPLMHQLGTRLWKGENDFEVIEDKWNSLLANSKSRLEADVANLFTNHDLQFRVYSGKTGQKFLYGIVSPQFVDVNQFEFRDAYNEEFAQITNKKSKSFGITNDRYGNIVETLDLETFGFQTQYKNVLVYAKNNGYDAYKVNWERYVLVCSNGLRVWRESKFRWKHTNEINLKEFISNTIAEGSDDQLHLEKCIERAKEVDLNQDLYSEMMNRLSLAHSSKMRIDERLKNECEEVGNNEWALSQAFTWLGTHDQYLPFSMKPKLGDFGTDILEKSLETVLQEKPKLTWDGYYGLLGSKDLKSIPNRVWHGTEYHSVS